MRKLTTTNLELAVWIARLGSFTAAAERMHTTQPAVSARVKELEESLGHQLFVRQGRGVQVTPEGREFIGKAEAVLRQIEELSVSFGKSQVAGIVRIGMSSIGLDLLAAVSIATGATMPRVTYEVEVDRAARLLHLLEARKLDLAVVSGPVEAHKFRSRSLGLDRMRWVASGRVMGERLRLPQAERLKDLPIWCVHPDSFYWSGATAGLRAQGADLGRMNAISNTAGVARVVLAGSGIGLVSERLVEAELVSGALVEVPHLAPCDPVEFSIVANAEDTSAIVDEVMARMVELSPFRRSPFED